MALLRRVSLNREGAKRMVERKLQVIIADNEPVVRELVDRHVSERGHAVHQAATGADCLKLMRNKACDLVFLDLVMPGIDGETALEVIHRRYPDTIVVVVSSLDDDQVIDKILKQGAHAYLRKPVTREHIEDVIRRVERQKDGGGTTER